MKRIVTFLGLGSLLVLLPALEVQALEDANMTETLVSDRVHVAHLVYHASAAPKLSSFSERGIAWGVRSRDRGRVVRVAAYSYGNAGGGRWVILRGSDLQRTLSSWCRRAGWHLVWNSQYSYTTEASAAFNGSFVQAVVALFDSVGVGEPRLYPTMYRGNRVILVTNKIRD